MSWFWRRIYRTRDIAGGIAWAIVAHLRWHSPRTKR